jgi:hypothetical protein
MIMGGSVLPPERDNPSLNLIRSPMIARQHPIRLPLTKRPPMHGTSPTTSHRPPEATRHRSTRRTTIARHPSISLNRIPDRRHPSTGRPIMIPRQRTIVLARTATWQHPGINTNHGAISRPNMAIRDHSTGPDHITRQRHPGISTNRRAISRPNMITRDHSAVLDRTA